MFSDAEKGQRLNNRLTLSMLAVLTVFAMALRLKGIGGPSLWSDEGATLIQVEGSFVEMLSSTARDTYPPGYNALAWLSVRLFGEGDVALRLPAAIMGIAAVPVMFLIARRLAGNAAGLLAALLHALSSFAIAYSQEARAYTLLMFAVLLTLGSSLAYVRRPTFWRGALMLLGDAVLLYSHPYGAVSFAAIAASGLSFLLAQRPLPLRPIAAFCALKLLAFALFLPWFFISLTVAEKLVTDGFWIQRPSVLSGMVNYIEILGGPFGAATLLFGAGAALWALVYGSGNRRPHTLRGPVFLLVVSAVAPALFGFLVSQVTTPVFIARYLIGCLPGATILAAIGYSRLGSLSVSRASAITVAVTVSLGLSVVLSYTVKPDENWRSAAAYLGAEMGASDCLAVSLAVSPAALALLEHYGFPPPACFYDVSASAETETFPWNKTVFFLVRSLGRSVDRYPGAWGKQLQFGGKLTSAVHQPS